MRPVGEADMAGMRRNVGGTLGLFLAALSVAEPESWTRPLL